MKYFKKLNKLLFISLLICLGINTSCECVRYKKTVGGVNFTFINDGKIQERIDKLTASLKHRQDENPGIIPPIIAGGRYGSVPHAEKYESHHLISAHFCRTHQNLIAVKDAPSVLILKDIHKFTGSFGGNSEQYFKKEQEAFNAGGLEAVLELGISDLNKLINQHYANYKPVTPKKFTPFKRAKGALQRINSKAYPGEDLSAFISTPLKKQKA